MPDFIMLMHDDTTSTPSPAMWNDYFATLGALGVFEGGSSIGAGTALRQAASAATTDSLAGFIRVRADTLADAARLVAGNPTYECGGTVEVRWLPRD